MRRSFEHPKHMLKLMGKKIFIILHSKICLSKPVFDISCQLSDRPFTINIKPPWPLTVETKELCALRG